VSWRGCGVGLVPRLGVWISFSYIIVKKGLECCIEIYALGICLNLNENLESYLRKRGM